MHYVDHATRQPVACSPQISTLTSKHVFVLVQILSRVITRDEAVPHFVSLLAKIASRCSRDVLDSLHKVCLCDTRGVVAAVLLLCACLYADPLTTG